jgi:hypothetical protein
MRWRGGDDAAAPEKNRRWAKPTAALRETWADENPDEDLGWFISIGY